MQLGHGKSWYKCLDKPAIIRYFIENTIKIVSISVGYAHNCALDENGDLYSWGYNCCYEIGNGDHKSIATPLLNETLRNEMIVNIKCAYYHNVALTKNDEYYLWGNNGYKQCLIYDEKTKYVKYPTKYEHTKDFDPKRYKIVAIYPGFHETRIVVQNKNIHL